MLDLADINDLREAAGLGQAIEAAFREDCAFARRARQSISYEFRPSVTQTEWHGLTFATVLNGSRQEYVLRALQKKNMPLPEPYYHDHTSMVPGGRQKRTLVGHVPPPGDLVCPFDSLSDNPFLFAVMKLDRKRYGLVMNARPWSYNHCMLVAFDPDPQEISDEGLRAAMYATIALGPGYEIAFSGVSAGASVYHFHLHIHRKPASIWQNLDDQRLSREQVCDYGKGSAHTLAGWPAPCVLFVGSEIEELVFLVKTLAEVLTKGDRDIPFNLGFRVLNGSIETILIPRASAGERPSRLNTFPNSWGAFAFQEMAGTIHLLTPEGYRATAGAGANISASIAEMGLSAAEMRKLVGAFGREL